MCRLVHTASLSSFWLEELFSFQITFCLLYFLHSGEVRLGASETCMKYTFSQNRYFWKPKKIANLFPPFLLCPHSGLSNTSQLVMTRHCSAPKKQNAGSLYPIRPCEIRNLGIILCRVCLPDLVI